MIEFRCQKCKRLLFKGKYTGTIQIKCNKCKTINEIECQEKKSISPSK